jgi:queuine tRNA-ribosyltransferase
MADIRAAIEAGRFEARAGEISEAWAAGDLPPR